MSYTLKRGESVAEGIVRVAGDQIAKGLHELHDPKLDTHDIVHQVRKRCKKLRGLFRLARGGALSEKAYTKENARYRDAARKLSGLRDAEALLETYDMLMDRLDDGIDKRQFGPLRRALSERRDTLAAGSADTSEGLASMKQAFISGVEELEELRFKDEGFDGLAPGLEKTYGRARKTMERADSDPSDEKLHEWRKRTKYHWYHVRLLDDIWPRAMGAREEDLDRLTNLLGEDHDLAVFRGTLEREDDLVSSDETREALFAIIEKERAWLQAQAFKLGAYLFAEDKAAHAARLRAYWNTWRRGNDRLAGGKDVERAA